MLECLDQNASKDCKETLDAVTESVDRFIDGADQFDDITMLIYEIKK